MRLHEKKKKQAISKTISESSVHRLKTPNVREALAKYFIYFFLRIGASAVSVASSPKSQSHPPLLGVTPTGIRTVLHKTKVGLQGSLIKNWKCTESSDKPSTCHVLRALGTALLCHQHGQGSTPSNGRKLTGFCKKTEKIKNSP